MDQKVILFLCGDIMTGRGIDQILRHSCTPELHEPYVTDARRYVEIAEEANGPIPRKVDEHYIWGDALAELERECPDARIVNLETAVTTSSTWWRGKGINYRMHPGNVGVLTIAAVDCCVLANNHVLDWGYRGLEETAETLRKAGIKTAGAARTRLEAEAPAVIEVGARSRVLVFAFGSPSAGIPVEWEATGDRAGINVIHDLSESEALRIGRSVSAVKRSGDIAVASLHWGRNWGFRVSPAERRFASLLIEAGIDVVHGHSSHHVRGIEVVRGRLVLYGCGDFLTDYEGIGTVRKYRSELGLMYFATVDAATGKLLALRMVPTRVRNFRVTRAAGADAEWLQQTLIREGRELGTSVKVGDDGTFTLLWDVGQGGARGC